MANLARTGVPGRVVFAPQAERQILTRWICRYCSDLADFQVTVGGRTLWVCKRCSRMVDLLLASERIHETKKAGE